MRVMRLSSRCRPPPCSLHPKDGLATVFKRAGPNGELSDDDKGRLAAAGVATPAAQVCGWCGWTPGGMCINNICMPGALAMTFQLTFTSNHLALLGRTCPSL